uniref:G_PROTEIN_RECEP_F1_2 domain-containing protein n=1 Tax=Heterorhabditis bacteriophora TaxID=37862 RepID=A0A1I7X0Z7_HETBA
MALFLIQSIMLHTYSHSILSLLLSFGFRHYIMIKQSPQLRTILLLTFLIFLPSAISTVTFSFCGNPDIDLLPILKQRYPQYDITGMVISGHIDLFTPLGMITVILICVITPLTYPFILYFRWATLKKIGEATFSEKTKKLHKELMKALTFQAMLPALYVFSVVSFGLGQLGIINHPFLENFTFEIVDWVPFLSPLCTFYVVGPYRKALLGIFTVIKNRGGKVNPNTGNMSSAQDRKLPVVSLQTVGSIRDSSNTHATNGDYHLNIL